jgi:hypothetical protein
MWAATFGMSKEHSTTQAQVELISSLDHVNGSSDTDIAVDFPRAPHSPAFDSIFVLTESLETVVKSPLPGLAQWFLKQLPYIRRATANKEKLIANEIDKAMKRFEGQAEKDQVMHCAVDDILRREILFAKKEDRAPKVTSRAIADEVSSLVVIFVRVLIVLLSSLVYLLPAMIPPQPLYSGDSNG